MWVKSCCRTAARPRLLSSFLLSWYLSSPEVGNWGSTCVSEWRRGGTTKARRACFSPCQPLEIPGNVIQCCALKNHSARNSPGQQRQPERPWRCDSASKKQMKTLSSIVTPPSLLPATSPPLAPPSWVLTSQNMSKRTELLSESLYLCRL